MKSLSRTGKLLLAVAAAVQVDVDEFVKAKMFVWEILGVARFKEALRYFSFGISLGALRSTVNPSLSSHPLPPNKACTP